MFVKVKKENKVKEVQYGNNYFMFLGLTPTLGLIPLIVYGFVYKRIESVISLYLAIFLIVFAGGAINGVFLAMGVTLSKSLFVNLFFAVFSLSRLFFSQYKSNGQNSDLLFY